MTILNLIQELLRKYSLAENPDEILDRISYVYDKPTFSQIREIFNNYNKYSFSLDVKNVGTDPKFIKSKNDKISLFDFINRQWHKREWPLESTPFTEALFGDNDFYDMVNKFNKINKQIKEKCYKLQKEKSKNT